MKKGFLITLFLFSVSAYSQPTPFEKSNGKETATYFEAIDFYKKLDPSSKKIMVREEGSTDAGYPLHLVLVSNDGLFDPEKWHKQNKVVLLINNGIHPGEPDGVDASMLLVRDIAANKIKLPANVALAIIPLYNIGGSLNRSGLSRPNQNGPVEYGFRGNSQNLDLNRDFTKCDSREARSFSRIFHYLQPDIQIDNHVSDGADYQHTMTLLTTQYEKLGTTLGTWLKKTFEPALYSSMAQKGWDMTPYVNFETSVPDVGMLQFYDPPMYSSGYAALFQTIGFMPETHMLKPFADRVRSTYALMQTFIEEAALHATELIEVRRKAVSEVTREKKFALRWKADSSQFSMITFKGYEQSFKTSEATGLQRGYYDHSKPFTKQVKYFNFFKPEIIVTKPAAYLVPQGWWQAIELLKLNEVRLFTLPKDSTIEVEVYHIDDCKPNPRSYEKHHRNTDVKVSVLTKQIKFLKGDYIIPMNQPANRYLVEMLEPTGEDSFFAWNFFDAVLQQKEHYSDYRWEDIAAKVVEDNPGLRQKLDAKKTADSSFAANAAAQLDFIHKHSPYYEPAHLQYPIFRLVH